MNNCLAFFYIYLFLEGVLRKWIIPGVSGTVLYSIKYLLLILIAILYYRQTPRENRIKTPFDNAYRFYAFIVVLSALCVTFAINGFIVGGITVIQYLSPIILIYALPEWLNNRRRLNKFIAVGAVIAFVVFILAFVQYVSPPYALINRYAVEMKNGIALVGGAARVCSVFSYITPFGDFCILSVVFTTLLLSVKTNLVTKWLIVILFVLSMLGGFMTGSRSVVLLSSIVILCASIHQCVQKKNPKLIIIITCIIGAGYTYYNSNGIIAVDNFLERVEEASYDVDTRVSRNFDIMRVFDHAGAFGNGVGIANLSVQSFLIRPSLIDFEEEIGRVMIEFGFIGFLLVSIIRLYTLIQMFKISKSVDDKYLSALSWATTIAIAPMVFYAQMCLYNWFAYMVFFTMIGLNLAINRIDSYE